MQTSYDIKGNITDHSGVGQFEYDASRPYAIAMVTPYGDAIPLRDQKISYNTLMRPSTISENGYTASFTYDSNGNRTCMEMATSVADMDFVRFYQGGIYETDRYNNESKNVERLYLGGDAYSAPAVYVKV